MEKFRAALVIQTRNSLKLGVYCQEIHFFNVIFRSDIPDVSLQVRCDMAREFARACSRNGMVLEWRSDTFCRKYEF